MTTISISKVSMKIEKNKIVLVVPQGWTGKDLQKWRSVNADAIASAMEALKHNIPNGAPIAIDGGYIEKVSVDTPIMDDDGAVEDLFCAVAEAHPDMFDGVVLAYTPQYNPHELEGYSPELALYKGNVGYLLSGWYSDKVELLKWKLI